MSDTRWDLRRIEDRLPEYPDRLAVRLVNAADVTEEIPIVLPRVQDGCRSRVARVRCGHEQGVHTEVGFTGCRQRCEGCGCREWRRPWMPVLQDVAIVVLTLAGIALFWFKLVPAVLEALAQVLT